MQIHELVVEMKMLERRLMLYEEKYGILSEVFYSALMSGKLERYDEFDETRADFSRWKGVHETCLRRKEARGHGAFLNGYAEEDEGLYDGYPNR